jgi:hypothetical protein
VERAELEHKIAHRGDGGRAHARAYDVNQRIAEDDGGVPQFTLASQSIAAATALLRGLPEPVTLEDHRAQCEICTLLEHTAVPQAESSMSR